MSSISRMESPARPSDPVPVPDDTQRASPFGEHPIKPRVELLLSDVGVVPASDAPYISDSEETENVTARPYAR